MLLAATASLCFFYSAGGPILAIDSYQYLSAASHFVHSGMLSTSLVHFDTERASGRMPAPLTTLAGGYPILIAALNFTGVPLITAGWIISAASLVLLVPAFYALSKALGLTPLATRLGLLLLVSNGLLLTYSATELTDLPFTAVSLAALACFLRRDGAYAPRLWVLGCVLAGLSYWIRYAGLFTVASLFLILPFLIYPQSIRRALSRLTWLGIPALLVGIVMARNITLTGTWQGGNTKHVSNPFLPTFKVLIVSFFRLFWGEHEKVRFGLPEMIFVGASIFMAVAIVRLHPKWNLAALKSKPLLALILYAGVYTLGFFYLGLSSVITFGPRMFVPLIPVVVLLACTVVSYVDQRAGQDRLWKAAVAVVAIGYLSIQSRELRAAPVIAPHMTVLKRLSEPAPNGQTVEQWLKTQVPSDDAVASTQGQETGYAIGRPVLSLVSPLYSTTIWNAETVHRTMQRFRTKYLILYPNLTGQEAPEQSESPSLSAILAGHLPEWLEPAIEDNDVRVYRCLDCGTAVRD